MRETALVRLHQVTKAYDEGDRQRVVFRHVDATIGRGEFLVVLGRSGSGKSTLLNLLSGIDLPTSGHIEVDGRCLDTMSERERTLFRRSRVGFVFQFFNLLPTLTVRENLWLPLELKGTMDGDGKARAAQLLQRVGLADRADDYPDRLSGGEQQRVAVARALVHQPDLLLADEPTGNLDQESGAAVAALLTELARQQGMTLVVVTHSSELAAMADRVLAVRDGQLVPASVP